MNYSILKLLPLVFVLISEKEIRAKDNIYNFGKGRPLGRHIQYYQDHSSSLDVQQILDISDQFIQSTDASLNFGISDSIVWIRLEIPNTTPAPKTYILESRYPTNDIVELFDKNGTQLGPTLGDRVAKKGSDFRHRVPVFELEVPSGGQTYFLKFRGQDAIIVKLHVWETGNFISFLQYDLGIVGIVLGTLAGLFCYNTLLWLLFPNRTSLYYLLYNLMALTCACIFMGVQKSFELPAPFSSWISNEGFVVAAGLGEILTILFAISFLQLDQRLKVSAKFLRLQILVYLMGLLVTPFDYKISLILILGTTLVTSLTIIFVGIECCRQRFRPAYFFTLGWGVLEVSILISVSPGLGLMSTSLLSDWAVWAGICMEVIIISLAIGDNIYREREKTQFIKAQIQGQLEAAHAVQATLFPTRIHTPELYIDSFNQAAEETGGDWLYYTHDTTNNRLYVVIGDVTGHGVSSALVTASAAGAFHSLLSTNLSDSERSSKEVLADLAVAINHAVANTGAKANKWMTMNLMTVDLKTGELSLINAGHTPLLSSHAKKVRAFSSNTTIIGRAPTIAPEFTSLQLQPGEKVLLYTDGLTDNLMGGYENLNHRKLRRILSEAASGEDLMDRLTNVVGSFAADPGRDDSAVVVFQWLGAA